MTMITLELPDDLAQSLESLPSQMRFQIAASALRAALPKENPTPLRSGAALVERLKSEGLLAGYGDPETDAPVLAAQLREEFSTKQTGRQ